MSQATDSVYLSDLSPKDKRWDAHRSDVDSFKNLYAGTQYDKYTARLDNCSDWLVFAFGIDHNGLCNLKLFSAHFCRVPMCPVCQWRRSLKWDSKTFQISPLLRERYPKSRYLLLTLTVPTCPLIKLRATLADMNKSWGRLTKLKCWPAQGWIRSTEVTRRPNDHAHPHFHCLLMVPSSYFGNNYISQKRWVELWKQCLRATYDPVVDIRAIKAPKDLPEKFKDDPLSAALVETIKYCFKPSDILKGDNCQLPGQPVRMTDQEWLVELTTQLYKTRKVATGGIFKEYLNVLEDERENDKEDLIHINEDEESDSDSGGGRMDGHWNRKAKRYNLTSREESANMCDSAEHDVALVN